MGQGVVRVQSVTQAGLPHQEQTYEGHVSRQSRGSFEFEQFLGASALSEMPQMSHGSCEDGIQDDAWFATVDGAAKHSILEWLSQHAPWYTPTFVRITKAAKTLNVHNSGPKLGLESTLPQYMPNDTGASALRPQQNEFPVWYFFYGTLANPSILSRVLERPEEANLPVLYPASVNGGVVRTWAGKYRALVDSPSGHKPSIVMGYAYLVQSKEEEDHLRIYETDKYDVVRCDIDFGCTHRIEKGLTFRFAGEEDELDKQAKGYRSLSMDVGRHFEDVSDILKAVSANL